MRLLIVLMILGLLTPQAQASKGAKIDLEAHIYQFLTTCPDSLCSVEIQIYRPGTNRLQAIGHIKKQLVAFLGDDLTAVRLVADIHPDHLSKVLGRQLAQVENSVATHLRYVALDQGQAAQLVAARLDMDASRIRRILAQTGRVPDCWGHCLKAVSDVWLFDQVDYGFPGYDGDGNGHAVPSTDPVCRLFFKSDKITQEYT